MQCCVAGVPTAANISSIANVPDDVAALNLPVASSVAVDSAVANVFLLLALLGLQQFSWYSAVSSVPAAVVVLTAVDVPGVHVVARVSAVAAVHTAVYVLSATSVSESLILLTNLLLLASLVLLVSLLLLRSLLLIGFPSIVASLLLASPDVQVVSCAAVAPPGTLVLSAVNFHGVLAVIRDSPMVPLMLWALLLLPLCLLFFSIGSGTPAVVGMPCFSICLLCCCQACC